MRVLFYNLVKYFFLICLKLYNRLRIRGKENIPKVDKVIVIANHCSNLDPIVAGVAFPERLRYLGKSELFSNPVFGFLIKALGAIPVSRESHQSAGSALRSFLTLLDRGENILIFPEGERSFDGKISSFQGGAALIAEKTGIPVVPAYIHGTHEAMPRGSSMVKPARIEIVFGKTVYPTELCGGLPRKEARQLLLETLEERLKMLESIFSDQVNR